MEKMSGEQKLQMAERIRKALAEMDEAAAAGGYQGCAEYVQLWVALSDQEKWLRLSGEGFEKSLPPILEKYQYVKKAYIGPSQIVGKQVVIVDFVSGHEGRMDYLKLHEELGSEIPMVSVAGSREETVREAELIYERKVFDEVSHVAVEKSTGVAVAAKKRFNIEK